MPFRWRHRFLQGQRDFVLAMEQITSTRTVDVVKVLGTARGIESKIKRAYDRLLAGI